MKNICIRFNLTKRSIILFSFVRLFTFNEYISLKFLKDNKELPYCLFDSHTSSAMCEICARVLKLDKILSHDPMGANLIQRSRYVFCEGRFSVKVSFILLDKMAKITGNMSNGLNKSIDMVENTLLE